MKKIVLKAKEFKKMSDPIRGDSDHVKYICYVQAKSIPQEIDEWMQTNPREQKMTTNVATKIKNSLSDNEYFHELNRGIVMSVQKATWNNSTLELELSLNDAEIHGNIDGGHTVRAILEAKQTDSLDDDRYVFFEIFEGNDSIIELASARNTSVQVDLKSIAELEKSFDVLKEALKGQVFANRVQYKMNEHYNESLETIDVREVIAIILMFSQEVYPFVDNNGLLNDLQPVQCYSGKEASLKKFLYLNSNDLDKQKENRELMINNMAPVLKDVFDLWDKIEIEFSDVASNAGKRYGTRKYSKYNNGLTVGSSFVYKNDLSYIIPKGIMYPIVASFRSLIQQNVDGGTYSWKRNPIEVWNKLGQKLVSIILDEKTDNPEMIGKNNNLWNNLLKEVYIYGYMRN